MEMNSKISRMVEERTIVSALCRICLQNVENATSLFSDNNSSKVILDKIYLCFQIILSSENYLPNVICNSCIGELNMANNFRLKCVTFEERFKLITENEQVECPYNRPLEQNDDLYEGSDTHESQNFHPQFEDTNKHDNNSTVGSINKCGICNKVLKTKVSLLKHIKSMHEKRKHIGKVTGTGMNRRYHCTKCSYSTPHSQTLVNHMRKHDGERPYHCLCGKSFTQSSSLSAHKKIHSDNMYFTCSICGKQFKHAFTLKKHLNVHATGTFTCSICQKKLKSKQSLQEHVDRHHNIRNFNCEDCGATFVSSSDLLNHKKKHSTEKNAQCHLCGYKTYAKKNLIMHLKRHAGNKAYKCEKCYLTVYTSSDLRRHARVHTREKPYACPTCTQRFSHSPSLNKHVRNVHGLEYKWADIKSLSKKFPIKGEKI